jgi:transcriptional regulator with XRE-family HTH domain
MTGPDFKAKVAELEHTTANLARKLEMLPQTLNQVFKSADVKSGMIERVAKLYNVPIGFFYGEEIKESNNNSNSNESQKSDGIIAYTDELANSVTRLEAQNKSYSEQVNRLLTMVEKLTATKLGHE